MKLWPVPTQKCDLGNRISLPLTLSEKQCTETTKGTTCHNRAACAGASPHEGQHLGPPGVSVSGSPHICTCQE